MGAENNVTQVTANPTALAAVGMTDGTNQGAIVKRPDQIHRLGVGKVYPVLREFSVSAEIKDKIFGTSPRCPRLSSNVCAKRRKSR